jgi:hypothetical protein
VRFLPNFRRGSALTLCLAAIATVSGCSPFSSNSTAATINGVSVSRDTIESYIAEFAANQQLPMTNGVIATEDARGVIAGVIKAKAYNQYLDSVGKPLTSAQRARVLKQIADQGVGNLSKNLQNLVVDINAATAAITALKTPSDATIEKLYKKSPSLTGAMCVRHIVVKKKETAAKMLELLSNGADFAALAKKYSIEPAAKQTGGALGGQTADGKPSPCMSILDYESNFDPAFTAGVLAAKAGVPYGPVQSSFGWHVILVEKWETVKDAALALVKAQPGANLATGWLANSHITVDPAYGHWSSATGSVVAN